MPDWIGSDRRNRLPSGWPATTRRIKERDGHRCTWLFRPGQRCSKRDQLEVDHIVAGDNHSDDNLRTLCHEHHIRKSGGEGAAALAKKVDAIHQRFRRTESHPGAL